METKRQFNRSMNMASSMIPMIRKDSPATPKGDRFGINETWSPLNGHTMRMREVSLIRSLFDFHQSAWGPNVTSAVAWMAKGELEEGWLHPIVDAVLELKVKLGRMPTEAAVAQLMADKIQSNSNSLRNQYSIDTQKRDVYLLLSGLMNGTKVDGNGQADPLPLSIQESEAIEMIKWYKGKSLWRLVIGTAENMKANFYGAPELARALKEELEKAL